MDTIGKRLRGARVAAALSQSDLAEASQVTQVTISAWERDVGPGPRLDDGARIASALGVSLRWLATGIGPASDEVAA